MTTTHRHRAGRAIPDDGSCWRSLGERQNCTATTFGASLNNTASAHLIGDAGDSHPGPVQMYGPERMRAPRWLLFVAGVACGIAAYQWPMFAGGLAFGWLLASLARACWRAMR